MDIGAGESSNLLQTYSSTLGDRCSNVPIAPQYFQPSQFFISEIEEGNTTIVTTTVNHNYVIGQLCRLIIPFFYGAQQLTNQSGYVISIPSATEVELTINSNNSDPFIPSPNLSGENMTPPQIMAIGEINSGATNVSASMMSTAIPGSFLNISPL